MPVQAKGAVFTAEIVPPGGAATGWADMRAAYEALDDETRERVAGCPPTTRCTTARAARATCRRSRTRRRLRPVRLPRPGAVAAAAGEGPPRHRPAQPADRPPRLRHRRHGPRRVRALPRPPQRVGLPAAARPPPPVGGRRRGDLGQPSPDAPGHAVRHDPAPPHVAHPHRRRAGVRARRQPRLTGRPPVGAAVPSTV